MLQFTGNRSSTESKDLLYCAGNHTENDTIYTHAAGARYDVRLSSGVYSFRRALTTDKLIELITDTDQDTEIGATHLGKVPKTLKTLERLLAKEYSIDPNSPVTGAGLRGRCGHVLRRAGVFSRSW